MSFHKASHYLNLLHVAINTSKYNEVPELSRKVRKHDPARTCYARCIEVQAYLLAKWQENQRNIDNENLNGQSTILSWLYVDQAELQKYSDKLAEALEYKSKASPQDRDYLETTHLFHTISVRNLGAAQQIAHSIPHPDGLNAIQVATLKGILHELTGCPQDAPRFYDDAAKATVKSSSPGAVLWRRYALYRFAILRPSQENFEQYLKDNTDTGTRSDPRLLHVLSTRRDSQDYQTELLRSTQFPPAEITNIRLLECVTGLVDSWMCAGELLSQAEKILELLYEAASKTFHSPRLLRYICHALSVLNRFDETYLALKAYLQVAVHAQKTRPGVDIDTPQQIVQLVHYVITNTFRMAPPEWQGYIKCREMYVRLLKITNDLHIEDPEILAFVEEINGISCLIESEALHDEYLLEVAIKHLILAIERKPTTTRYLELSRAYISSNRLIDAMSTIRQSLQLEAQNTVALLFLANLLCCEELFDRALLVLSKIKPRTIPLLCQNTIHAFTARIMELRIIAVVGGPAKALQQSVEIMSVFSEYFGVPANKSPANSAGVNGACTSAVPGKENTIFAPQIPRIEIVKPATNGTQSNGHHINSINTAVYQTIDEAHFNRTHETGGVYANSKETSRPPSRQGIRSASLKLSHPHIYVPHHLPLRKSASARSMRNKSASLANDSSRSSSPLNYPSSSSVSFLEQAIFVEPQSDEGGSSQDSSADLEARKYNNLLADLWLLIARFARESEDHYSDSQQAIDEARKLIGNTPDIMAAELELRSSTLEVDGDDLATREAIKSIEQGYEIALDADPTNHKMVFCFAKFLMSVRFLSEDGLPDFTETPVQVGRLARAYELLESLKMSQFAPDPELWRVSADLATLREEYDRAELEYWKVVNLSDCAGIIKWTRLC